MASLVDKILGRPLKTSEAAKESLGIVTGVPMLGLDALSSVAYGPEAALTVLIPLGMAGLRWMPLITAVIVALLSILYLSYRQTIAAYPNGGGSYIVASQNLGKFAGILAGASLLLDYILTVAVGISAGIATVVSAVPGLQHHTLFLCLGVLALLAVINLRGVRESGLVFAAPTFAFLGCVGGATIIGLVRMWLAGGHPIPIEPLPAVPRATETVSAWLLLRAFASGCTAMTGVEAVSNGVPLFRKPQVPIARLTLTVIVVLLGLCLLGVAWLCPAYHLVAMDQQKPGYQTMLSQLIIAATGRGVFYYISIGSILIILTFSANTSFADFPRVCRLLAADGFLPPSFAHRGRRLVFAQGIIVLALVSALILALFGGTTDKLIPLYAVGAFGAFTLSQAGMVAHWVRQRGVGVRMAMAVNGVGAVCTGMALAIIIVAKFIEGAWITLIILPGIVALFYGIHKHYQKVKRGAGRVVKLETEKAQPPVVIVPINGWNQISERCLCFAMQMSGDVIALHVTAEPDEECENDLRELWAQKVEKPARAAHLHAPLLEIAPSPYRQIYPPIIDLVRKTRKSMPDRFIAVVIPELVNPRWYEYLLHNHHGAVLRARLFLEHDHRTAVITVPWRLSNK